MKPFSLFKSLSYYLLPIAFIAACTQADKVKTDSGIEIQYVQRGEGEPVQAGQYVETQIMYKDYTDSVWLDTRDGIPIIMQMPDSVSKEDLFMGVFQNLKKGDSVIFKISASQVFKHTFRRPLPEDIDSAGYFTFYLGVTNCFDFEGAQKRDQELRTQQRQVQLQKDSLRINKYLKDNEIQAKTTASGLRYVITQPGSGAYAQTGQKVSIHYTGYLLNGKIFDSSMESTARANGTYTEGRAYEPIQVVVGHRQVIEGWEEAMTLMQKGTQMTVYIPSSLAYGEAQKGPDISPNSILVFDMQMIDIVTTEP